MRCLACSILAPKQLWGSAIGRPWDPEYSRGSGGLGRGGADWILTVRRAKTGLRSQAVYSTTANAGLPLGSPHRRMRELFWAATSTPHSFAFAAPTLTT